MRPARASRSRAWLWALAVVSVGLVGSGCRGAEAPAPGPEESTVWSPGEPIVLSGPEARSVSFTLEKSDLKEATFASALEVRVSGLHSLLGTAWLQARWNDGHFLLLKFRPLVGLTGQSLTEWTTADDVNGRSRGYEVSDSFSGWLSNFAPTVSPQAGENILEFRMEGATDGVTATILPASRIVGGIAGPSSLTFSAKVEDGVGPPTLRIRVHATNRVPIWFDAYGSVERADRSLSAFRRSFDAANFANDGIAEVAFPIPGVTDRSEVARLTVSLVYPSGQAGPLEFASNGSWTRQKSGGGSDLSKLWLWVAVGTVPALWLSLSSAWRAGRALRSAAATAALLALSLVLSACTSQPSSPPYALPALPRTDAIAREGARQVAQSVIEQGWVHQISEPWPRPYVWPILSNGSPVGYMVEFTAQTAAWDCHTGEPSVRQLAESPLVWIRLRCDD